MKQDLQTLRDLLRERNAIDAKIAALIERPAERGHIGEYIGAAVFDIELAQSAASKGSDGIFRSGPLQGRTVNVKFYGKRDGCLDMKTEGGMDFYLVLTGASSVAMSSRGTTRPLVIEAAYLLESAALLAALGKRSRPPKIGVATSVASEYWSAAEIWPTPRTTVLPLTDEQRQALQQFASGQAV